MTENASSTFKTSAKALVERLPLPVAEVFWALSRWRWRQAPPGPEYHRATERVRRKLKDGDHVASGPFVGMRYLHESFCSALLPKLLGTYELELSPAIEDLLRESFDQVVHIGAAEGYYAVGLALRMPHTRAVCFELNPSARHLLRMLAQRNGVTNRLSILEGCTTQLLNATLAQAPRSVVICDCDGPEEDLLDPALVPALRSARMVVETHDSIRAGVTDELVRRFNSSHAIERLIAVPRSRRDAPADTGLSDEETMSAMNEIRHHDQTWLVMIPK